MSNQIVNGMRNAAAENNLTGFLLGVHAAERTKAGFANMDIDAILAEVAIQFAKHGNLSAILAIGQIRPAPLRVSASYHRILETLALNGHGEALLSLIILNSDFPVDKKGLIVGTQELINHNQTKVLVKLAELFPQRISVSNLAKAMAKDNCYHGIEQLVAVWPGILDKTNRVWAGMAMLTSFASYHNLEAIEALCKKQPGLVQQPLIESLVHTAQPNSDVFQTHALKQTISSLQQLGFHMADGPEAKELLKGMGFNVTYFIEAA